MDRLGALFPKMMAPVSRPPAGGIEHMLWLFLRQLCTTYSDLTEMNAIEANDGLDEQIVENINKCDGIAADFADLTNGVVPENITDNFWDRLDAVSKASMKALDSRRAL